MIALADIIADELAKPDGHILQERLLQAMFMFERFRGIDAGWRDMVSEVAEADVSPDAIWSSCAGTTIIHSFAQASP